LIEIYETARLILRPLREADLEDFFEYAQDPRVAGPGLWEPYDSNEACRQDLERLIADYGTGLLWWGIEHIEAGKLVGRVQLTLKQDRVELSYALHHDFWGRRLMSEAVQPIVAQAWSDPDINALEAVVRPDNVASIRILENLGLKFEARLPREEELHLYVKGRD